MVPYTLIYNWILCLLGHMIGSQYKTILKSKIVKCSHNHWYYIRVTYAKKNLLVDNKWKAIASNIIWKLWYMNTPHMPRNKLVYHKWKHYIFLHKDIVKIYGKVHDNGHILSLTAISLNLQSISLIIF